jgi:hypothetical protein
MVIIEGYVSDSARQPLVGIPVEAFQVNPLGDLALTASPHLTGNEGYFKIVPQRNIDDLNSNAYIIITDESKRFVSLRDRHSRYKRKEGILFNGGNKWMEMEKPDYK